MSRILSLVGAVVGGAALYALAFLFVLDKPMTTGATRDYYAQKLEYMERIAPERKIVIYAGSNGRFSHRCETIERETGMKCLNASVAAGANLVWELSHYWEYMHAGDILYMPLEYMTEHGAFLEVGTEADYVVAYDHSALRTLYTPRQAMSAVFGFGIRDFFESIGEMGLKAAGKQTRYSVKTLTLQGDESGHVPSRGKEYAAFVRQQDAPHPIAALYRSSSEMAQVEKIIRLARDKGVIVVGGLPTTVSEAPVTNDVVSAIRDFYASRGECFVALPNLSQYPVGAFYDSNYHLSEPAQIRHSLIVGSALKDIARQNGCATMHIDPGSPRRQQDVNANRGQPWSAASAGRSPG
jgi:hypothetical protein